MSGFEEFVGVNFWTALFTLGNFIILFVVAKKFLFVPVKNMIDSRQKEIDAMYAQADAAKESAQALEEEYKAQLAAAQQTGDELVREAMLRGKNREEEIVRQAAERAAEDGMKPEEFFWPEYQEIVAEWPNYAVSFHENGMNVTFSPYELAAYAAGAQTFQMSYEWLKPYLDEHGLEVLELN